MITVVDPDAARVTLAAGRLGCPRAGCGGVLRVWSRARVRAVRMLGGRVEQVHPDRGRCRSCLVTHVLLPAAFLPRRGYGVEVVGAALMAAAQGAGCTGSATAAGVQAITVRGWLRAATRAAPALTARAFMILRAAGTDLPLEPRPGSPTPAAPGAPVALGAPAAPGAPAALGAPAGPRGFGAPLWAVLDVLGAAAHAFGQTLALPRRPGPGGTLTGIDYLAILAEQYRRQVHHQLALADPTGAAAHCPPWHLITVITGGQLLTTRPG